MKRERRILGVTGNDKLIVGVLYRGSLWFEGIDVKYLRRSPIKVECVVRSKYLEQAGVILLDEEVFRLIECKVKELHASIRRPIVIVRGEDVLNIYGIDERIRIQKNVPEALRIARKIFYEVLHIMEQLGER